MPCTLAHALVVLHNTLPTGHKKPPMMNEHIEEKMQPLVERF
jgi:hypothetical protein